LAFCDMSMTIQVDSGYRKHRAQSFFRYVPRSFPIPKLSDFLIVAQFLTREDKNQSNQSAFGATVWEKWFECGAASREKDFGRNLLLI
jgi:hypothetical protein